jgi:hypothetical protein
MTDRAASDAHMGRVCAAIDRIDEEALALGLDAQYGTEMRPILCRLGDDRLAAGEDDLLRNAKMRMMYAYDLSRYATDKMEETIKFVLSNRGSRNSKHTNDTEKRLLEQIQVIRSTPHNYDQAYEGMDFAPAYPCIDDLNAPMVKMLAAIIGKDTIAALLDSDADAAQATHERMEVDGEDQAASAVVHTFAQQAGAESAKPAGAESADAEAGAESAKPAGAEAGAESAKPAGADTDENMFGGDGDEPDDDQRGHSPLGWLCSAANECVSTDSTAPQECRLVGKLVPSDLHPEPRYLMHWKGERNPSSDGIRTKTQLMSGSSIVYLLEWYQMAQAERFELEEAVRLLWRDSRMPSPRLDTSAMDECRAGLIPPSLSTGIDVECGNKACVAEQNRRANGQAPIKEGWVCSCVAELDPNDNADQTIKDREYLVHTFGSVTMRWTPSVVAKRDQFPTVEQWNKMRDAVKTFNSLGDNDKRALYIHCLAWAVDAVELGRRVIFRGQGKSAIPQNRPLVYMNPATYSNVLAEFTAAEVQITAKKVADNNADEVNNAQAQA